MAASAGSPLLKVHWLPHPFFHVLQKETYHNTTIAGRDENKSSFNPLKNTSDKKLSSGSSERDDNKERLTGSIYAFFILLYGSTQKMFLPLRIHGVMKKQGWNTYLNTLYLWRRLCE